MWSTVGHLLANNSRSLCISKQTPQKSARRPSASSHPKSTHHVQPEETQPYSSFLFAVKELQINDNTWQGGVAPRADQYGYWIPPIYAAGLLCSNQARLYKWSNGVINGMSTDYQTMSPYLVHYRTKTVFYCNPWSQFQAAVGDASAMDMATANVPNDRWYPLSFHHDGGISRVDVGGSEQYLAGTGGNWVTPLGLNSYHRNHPDLPAAEGLAGDLAILIALIAFSCEPRDFDRMLLYDRPWHSYRWIGHHRRPGRKQRGPPLCCEY